MHKSNRPAIAARTVVYDLETLLPLLVKSGEITREQAQTVIDRARDVGFSSRDPEGLDFIARLGLSRQRAGLNDPQPRVAEEIILTVLAAAHGLEFKRVDPIELDLDVSTRTISESFARKNMLVPLRVRDGTLEVLAYNPFHPELWQDLGYVVNTPVRVYLGTRAEIDRLVNDFYQFRAAIQGAEKDFASGLDLGNQEQRVQVGERLDPTSQKHVIKAVDYLLATAMRERASDIHIEPKRERAEVRFRIDGVLHTLYKLPMTVHQAMISRLKSLSRLDIAEKRRPQDGRIQLNIEERQVEVRVSTLPVAFGEKMVLRLLSSQSTLKPLEELGMNADQLKTFRGFLSQTNGLVLVTGPTGSGKTTTLYSCLKLLSGPEVNVITVEDPIEMVVDDFNQIGIQPKIGVDFGSVLRHILRQDPDIIMIGEMRDLETAEQAVQASLTGHMVFSTLHTNDAASSITRLLELGLPAYLINAAVTGVAAQRLARSICPHCKVRTAVTPQRLAALGVPSRLIPPGATFHKGAGCEYCRRTGYLGRVGLFELLPLTDEFKEAVRSGLELMELRNLARSRGIRSLFEDGLAKALAGVTTLDEVIRVAGTAQE